jgi:hypothetical protein
MTSSETQEPVELTCAECEHVFISNLGTTVLAEVTTSPDGNPGPYLHFCSPECADAWHAKHGAN